MSPNNLFYFLFYPRIALRDWNTVMLESLTTSLFFIVIGCVVYWVWKYNRKTEAKKYWIILSLGVIINFIYILWKANSLPDEMLRKGYKPWYIFNHTLSSAIYSVLFFYLLSTWIGAKQYFIRIHEYIRK